MRRFELDPEFFKSCLIGLGGAALLFSDVLAVLWMMVHRSLHGNSRPRALGVLPTTWTCDFSGATAFDGRFDLNVLVSIAARI